MKTILNVLICWLIVAIHQGDALCFFPTEFQGEFLTQSSSRGGSHVQYAPVTVLPESIPVWGVCHRRFGNKVILMDRTGGTNCVRCFQLTLRSLNVVQIHTEGLEKCYTTEEAAMATCPTEESIMSGKSREIMLYKTKELTGEPVIAQEYCPINGRYVFTYSLNDGLDNVSECQDPISEASNCPYGFGLNLRFRRCSFGDLELNFQCLGAWLGHNGERYMALLDMEESGKEISNSAVERRPRYRCAIYREDPESGRTYVALSSDSTCQNDLKSATNGYETMVLSPTIPAPFPLELTTASCQFPSWTNGQWQDAYIEADTLIYKDLRNFRMYTVKCVHEERSRNRDEGKYMVFARTQCGEEFYTCLVMEKRGINLFEFQLGHRTSKNFNQSLCQSEKFQEETWITQGRIDVFSEESCPVSGEYTGTIPDATGLCAKLSSDCHNSQKMHYTVSNCFNQSEIYEEREYRCLGQFADKGLTYTYTERRDLFGYECFVGIIISESEVFIKEAGENCQRDAEPLKMGMKLVRQASCFAPRPSSKPNVIGSSSVVPGSPRDKYPPYEVTTKLWQPVQNPSNEIDSGSWHNSLSVYSLLLPLVTYLCAS